MRFTIAAVALFIAAGALAQVPPAALRYRADLQREVQFVMGLSAPIPMFAAQIEQESSWNASITAWDNGRGLAQFMDPTAKWVAETFKDLGPVDPYNPRWAMRAMVRLDTFNFKIVKGENACEQWGAALKCYNAGCGFVQRAQRQSMTPATWFGATEYINAGQSATNFEYSRNYPRVILFKRQSKYIGWGPFMCITQP